MTEKDKKAKKRVDDEVILKDKISKLLQSFLFKMSLVSVVNLCLFVGAS